MSKKELIMDEIYKLGLGNPLVDSKYLVKASKEFCTEFREELREELEKSGIVILEPGIGHIVNYAYTVYNLPVGGQIHLEESIEPFSITKLN